MGNRRAKKYGSRKQYGACIEWQSANEEAGSGGGLRVRGRRAAAGGAEGQGQGWHRVISDLKRTHSACPPRTHPA